MSPQRDSSGRFVSSTWSGPAVKAAIKAAGRRALTLAGEHLLTESNKVVPIEEATLERSGQVDADDDQVAISYDTPYAVRQHEDVSLGHDPGRKAKYLEETVEAEKDVASKIVSREIGRALR
jgi:hypothetical protein